MTQTNEVTRPDVRDVLSRIIGKMSVNESRSLTAALDLPWDASADAIVYEMEQQFVRDNTAR